MTSKSLGASFFLINLSFLPGIFAYVAKPVLLMPAKALERHEPEFRVAGTGGDWKTPLTGLSPMLSREALEDSMNDDAGIEVTVFSEAIRVPLQERAAFLDNACGDDENLRRKVEVLLNAHDRIGDFLEEPPAGASIE